MEERLFETEQGAERRTSVPKSDAPLAARMRPRDLDERQLIRAITAVLVVSGSAMGIEAIVG